MEATDEEVAEMKQRHQKTALYERCNDCWYGKWPCPTAKLLARLEAVERERDRLREVLQTISTTHCAYPDLPTPYQIGVTDGHRCAANMAREALKEGDDLPGDR